MFLAFKELLFYLWVALLLFKNQILTFTSPKAYVPEMIFWIQIFEHLLHVVDSYLFICLVIKLAIHDEYHTSSQDVMVTEIFVYSLWLKTHLFLLFSPSWCLVYDLFLVELHLFEDWLCSRSIFRFPNHFWLCCSCPPFTEAFYRWVVTKEFDFLETKLDILKSLKPQKVERVWTSR